ncbi:MAG: uroporphyrinogen-III synthase [Candidatus Dormibacteria bacterium]
MEYWTRSEASSGRLLVLVTRGGDAGQRQAAALRRAGFETAVTPMVRIEPVAVDGISAALGTLGPADWVAFTSQSAVAAVAAPDSMRCPRARIAAVGPGTANALRVAGWRVDLVPSRQDGQGLAQALLERGAAGHRVLLPQAEEPRAEPAVSLSAAGAAVERIAVYRTVADPGGAASLRHVWSRQSPDAIALSSPSAAAALAAAAREAELNLSRIPVFAIGATTAAAARDLGLLLGATAATPDPDALAAAVGSHFYP